MSTPRLPLTGGCQCGQLCYEVTAAPLAVYACHCTECQRQTGSAFGMSMPAPRDAVRITAGEPKRWDRIAGSGSVVTAVFCPDCGTRIFHEVGDRPDVAIVKPGTLDDTGWLDPVAHFWTRSAQPWTELVHEGLVYERQSPGLKPVIEAWQARQADKG
jgi:hypothetical protein